MASAVRNIAGICGVYIASIPLRIYLGPLETNIVLWLWFAAYAFIKSNFTGNYSAIDELWSLIPIFYSLHFNKWSYRGNLMVFIVFLWGIRLTYNFWRKGGYRGGEDYRWRQLRQSITDPVLWQLFNLSFISLYKTLLLMTITLPVYYETPSGLGVLDFILALVLIGFIVLETIADQQQWDFQCEKLNRSQSEQNIQLGFITTGLFKYSRHPNLFADACIWWFLYFFTNSLNISIIGPILMSALIYPSIKFTESLSLSKYTQYKNYQETTSMLIPWFPNNKKKSV
jgi:steroid 5-alpha reductase family enzyme